MKLLDLIENKDLNVGWGEAEITYLQAACFSKNSEIAELLIKHGANVDIINCMGNTPLMFASNTGNIEVLKIFLSHGAKVNAISHENVTSICFAAQRGQKDAVKLLLDNGAIPDHSVDDGFTPLMLSAEKGHLETVEVLLMAGVDINRKANNGLNSLMLSYNASYSKTAKILVKKGADKSEIYFPEIPNNIILMFDKSYQIFYQTLITFLRESFIKHEIITNNLEIKITISPINKTIGPLEISIDNENGIEVKLSKHHYRIESTNNNDDILKKIFNLLEDKTVILMRFENEYIVEIYLLEYESFIMQYSSSNDLVAGILRGDFFGGSTGGNIPLIKSKIVGVDSNGEDIIAFSPWSQSWGKALVYTWSSVVYNS